MIIYNVTCNIDKSINKEWLEWIKHHIPQVLATGKFKEAKLTKVLVDGDEADTYSIQYRAHSRATLDAYYKEDAARLREEGLRRFSDKMLAFRTELEIVDEYSITLNS
jgi:hypothetical protein